MMLIKWQSETGRRVWAVLRNELGITVSDSRITGARVIFDLDRPIRIELELMAGWDETGVDDGGRSESR